MKFRQLRSCFVLAEELHFGRSAARLHIVQPALSQQLRTLEADADTTLIERTTQQANLIQTSIVILREVVAQKGTQSGERLAHGRLARIQSVARPRRMTLDKKCPEYDQQA